MEKKDIQDGNIFMMCEKVNENAYIEIPKGFHLRKLKEKELDLWMEFPFDNDEDKKIYKNFMIKYYNDVYLKKKDLFFNSCLVLCDNEDKPVSTCFAWKAYDKFWTIHWFKTLKHYEGKKLGRAILTQVMKTIPKDEYPVYLHTQPGSFRAIKIYSDYGFNILTDEKIGKHNNDYRDSLDYLKRQLGGFFKDLKFVKSDETFSIEVEKHCINEF